MQPITTKRVYDDKGGFTHLELIQGQNRIVISLSDSSTLVKRPSYNWDILQDIINKHKEDIRKYVQISTGNQEDTSTR